MLGLNMRAEGDACILKINGKEGVIKQASVTLDVREREHPSPLPPRPGWYPEPERGTIRKGA